MSHVPRPARLLLLLGLALLALAACAAAPEPPTETSATSLDQAASIYLATARANTRQIDDRWAVVPSPAYANGIYARDAFYTTLGLSDLDLSEQAYRWFEAAQDPETGQIATAVPFDPADSSLVPQDDETTLIFLIWSGMLAQAGRVVDEPTVDRAYSFVRSRVQYGHFVSQGGQFRYWADCWAPRLPDVIAYNQGLYALALRSLADAGLAGVTPALADDAARRYAAFFRPEQGFVSLGRFGAGRDLQDLSALLPEFLSRYLVGRGMLPDAAVVATVDHHLATAAVRDSAGRLVGIKNLAQADGSFAQPDLFACATLRKPGDYQNGGHWPLFASVDLALAHSIDPQDRYRAALHDLAGLELADGSPKEYWELSPGSAGHVHPGRNDHAWNALIVPALRMAGLIR